MFCSKIRPFTLRSIINISLALPGVAFLPGCGSAELDAGETEGLANEEVPAESDVLGESELALQRQPRVRYVGRVDTSDPNVARFGWSGTGVTARFFGTSAKVTLGGEQQYTVLIDGVVQPKLVSTGGTYLLASGLPRRAHQVELYRRVEAHQGESEFYGFDFGSGVALSPSRAPERRIEIIGDSNTCGYGNEGAGPNCPYTPDTQNHYLSYGAIAARNVDAELSTLCWSGKGIVCNYGDEATSCVDPMPAFLGRTLPERADSTWDHSRFQPQAVVINLGANDISTAIDPSQQELEAAYGELLRRTRERYPEALILATLGPMRPERQFLMTYFENAIARRAAAGDRQVMTIDLPASDPTHGLGCDYHPSLLTHERLAAALTDALRTELGW